MFGTTVKSQCRNLVCIPTGVISIIADDQNDSDKWKFRPKRCNVEARTGEAFKRTSVHVERHERRHSDGVAKPALQEPAQHTNHFLTYFMGIFSLFYQQASLKVCRYNFYFL